MEEDTLFLKEDDICNELIRWETPFNGISTQGIEIFYTKTDTKSHSLLDLGRQRQGL